MDRRDFLRLAGAAGLSVMLPGRGFAQEAPIDHFFVFVHAGGGWDPTMLCDPKGMRNEEDEDPVNHFLTDDIGTAGNLRYAPIGDHRAFFDKHYQRTLVINGVDSQTNNHDSGTRHMWSGKLAEGYPALAALIAGTQARSKPMAFISNGGYDLTGGLVAPTRTGNIGLINRIAFPNAIDPRNPVEGERYHTDATYERIQAALERRRGWLGQRYGLPKATATQDALYAARVGKNEVRQLSEYLPQELERGLKGQAQVCCAAFRAGIAKTANLTRGGFDTHGNHDDAHTASMSDLLAGVDFLWDEAERQGIADKLTVVMGSDFGRTPSYNSGNGKDHWAITSVMLMGKGIPGNRVIGGTDERVRPLTVDPGTLALSDGGIRIEPGHIHAALRRLAGVDSEQTVQQVFPLIGVANLPLLG
ncbi:MAG: DUF1501 domain-containing protein [Myxococcales bacterium]|nr:DUF1501 domain-containing protein [Myxococcales bacterium]